MKPIYLELAGWGPYKNKECVDFEKLGGKGLFLVTGQTGAGKSTIFDAISYALFGFASGESRKDLNFRSDFADIEDKTYVNLTFSHHGKIYRVSRNPEYERKSLRGGGSTKNKADALLERQISEGKFEAVCSGVNDVTKAIEELIGVNYDQFKLIAFLPQGEFQKLLLAKSKERGEIFRGIFNARIYKDIQQKMNEKTLKLKRSLEGLDSLINEAINNIDLDDEEWVELIYTPDGKNRNIVKVIEYTQNCIKADKDKEKELEDEATKNDKELDKINLALDEAKRVAKLKKALEDANKTKADLAEKDKDFVELKAKCALAENYLRVLPSYELFMQSEKSLKNANAKAEGYAADLAKIEKDAESLDEKIKALTNKKESIEKDKKLTEDLTDFGNFVNDYFVLKKKYNKEIKAYKEAEKAVKKAKAVYEDAIETKNHAAIGLLVKGLKEGEPCPVCGSLTHPAPNKEMAADIKEISDEEIEEYKKDLEEKEKEEKAIHEKAAGFYKLCQSYEERFDSDEFSDIKARFLLDSLDKAMVDGKNISKEKKEIIKQIEVFEEEFEKAGKEKENLDSALNTLKGKAQENKNEIGRLKEGIKGLKADYEKVLKEAAFESTEAFEAAKMSEQDLKKNKDDIDEFEKSKVAIAQSIKDLTENLKDAGKIDAEKLSEQKKEAEDKKKNLGALVKQIHAKLVKNEGHKNSIKKHFAERQKDDKVYEKLSYVNRLMSGFNPKTIKFEDYVLMLYFDRILNAANRRFKLMSEERYTFKRKDDNIDRQSKGALDIEVFDKFTGKLRPVASLSGGEMFKAALSLSFGLSDVIQQNAGGIEIDTLFVDEGFGSLDNQSLDVAIAALTTVSKDSRLVGIISHVDELKTRIDTQISIEKTKLGSRIIQ